MERREAMKALAVFGAAAAAIGGGGWWFRRSRRHETCEACARHVHETSRVVGRTDSGRVEFCCAACAFAFEDQTRQPLEIASVAGFDTGSLIDPRDAVFVTGSSLNLCMRHEPLIDANKDAAELHFDRCAPSAFAFADEAAARRFQGKWGGRLTDFGRLSELLR